MDLTIYDVIQGPVMTDKAFRMNRDLKQLVLKVHPHANKPLIKEAIEKLFDVKVKKIRVLRKPGKRRMVNRRVVIGPAEKKAVIILAKGYSIDLFDQTGKHPVKAENDKVSAESVG